MPTTILGQYDALCESERLRRMRLMNDELVRSLARSSARLQKIETLAPAAKARKAVPR